MLFLQMSLEKVNDGFEGDQKTLVKERDVSLEEGKGGDDGNQVGLGLDELISDAMKPWSSSAESLFYNLCKSQD